MPAVSFGAGFRTPHFDEITRAPRALDWFEVLSDGFIGVGGRRRAMLENLRADYPILLHGVSLSIAGSDPLDGEYMRGLRELCDRIEPISVSDHLCWTALGGHESHDLLPVALTLRVLDHVSTRVARVQDALGRRLLLENATVYVVFRGDELDESEFFSELCRRTGCGMLLDVNNLYVNAQNLGIDPHGYLGALPREIVGYMHLAGHAVLPDVRIDTHDAEVPLSVWELFDVAARRFPDAGVILERDDNLPPFAELRGEVELARARHARALAAGRAPSIDPPQRAARPRSVEPRAWSALQRELFERMVDKPGGFEHRADAGLTALFDDARPVAAARGVRVYSDAYAASLPRALAVNFPALARVVDPADFAALCGAYLRSHPPRGHDFRELGAKLAEFARTFRFARQYGIEQSALAELVALEQAQLEVQDEVDEAEPLVPAVLAALTAEQWEAARFHFARALRIVRTTHDVLPVVEAVARGEVPARPKQAHTAYLVFRSACQLHTQPISEREARLYTLLVGGASFAETCEAAHARDATELGELTLEVVRVLVAAAERGLLLRCEV